MLFEDALDRASTADLTEAYGDSLALRLGLAIQDPHPLARRMSRDLSATDFAARLNRLPHGADLGALSRALNSSDFGSALEVALTRIVGLTWGRSLGSWESACVALPSRGTRPTEAPTIELGQIEELPNIGVTPLVPINIDAGNAVAPKRYGFRFLVGRELLVSDETELAAAWVAHLTVQAARLVPRLIGAVLSANPNLADGSPLLNADNTTAAIGLDVMSSAQLALGESFERLRNATAAATPAFLLVPPNREVTARLLVASITAGASALPLKILVNPWMGPDVYLLADPTEAPVFALVRPAGFGSAPSVIKVPSRTQAADGSTQVFDGHAFLHETWIGVGPISRVGIVKIPAS